MTETTVTDASGCQLSVVLYKGELFPPFPTEAIQKLETFDFRDDDIIISAYPKAGTHWVWEIVRMLQEGTTDLPVTEKDDFMIEFHPDVNYFTAMPSPRILSTHVLFRHLPRLSNAKCKIIYITRNPRDVAVSFYNHHRKLTQYYHYQGTWDDYFQLFLHGKLDYGSWFDYTREWEAALKTHPNLQVLTLAYEDLKENPESEVQRIAQFMGKTYDSPFMQSVCDKCTFSSMQQRKGKFDMSADGQPIMYRKGQVGDWQNWFAPEQVRQMDEMYQSKMADCSLTFRYTISSSITGTPDS